METLKNGGKPNSATTSRNLPNGKQDLSSTRVRMLTKSEILSLQESKRMAYEMMMKMN